jgi:hypothetical protein
MTTFVLVHGAWVGGWYWSEVADRLRKAGHRVEVIEQLPSAGTDPAALGDLAADAEAVKQTVDRGMIGELGDRHPATGMTHQDDGFPDALHGLLHRLRVGCKIA